MTNVSGLLRKGVKNIDRYGWVQEEAGDIQTGFCMLGAIGVETIGENNWTPESRYHQAHSALETHLGMSVVAWNDTPGRTKREVTEVMLTVADKFDAEAGVLATEGLE